MRVANGRRETASDELVRLIAGESPWRANLGRGSRMKQAGKVSGGASRRGCAKHRGRNIGRVGSLPASGLLVLTSRWRDGTPRKVLAACARRAGRCGWNSEEGVSPREDEPATDRCGGRRQRDTHEGSAGNSSDRGGSERPRRLVTPVAQNTLKGRQPQERGRRRGDPEPADRTT